VSARECPRCRRRDCGVLDALDSLDRARDGDEPDYGERALAQSRFERASLSCLRTQLATLKAERDEMAKRLGMATGFRLSSDVHILPMHWRSGELSEWIVTGSDVPTTSFPTADAAFAALDKLVAAARKGG
jgi:hypothetical protein